MAGVGRGNVSWVSERMLQDYRMSSGMNLFKKVDYARLGMALVTHGEE
uniref:Uncharacterized protein n=1 Tax=Talaromyces marneffei PM1 TaxID=1077442 RepID=A0A093VYD9_TALMA